MFRTLNSFPKNWIETGSILIFKRYAGHSKWANIKHIKAAKDGQRSQLFTRLCQRIKVAIQEGGSSNPEHNLHLAQAIEVAKKQCMPITSINSCIKSVQNDKSKAQSTWYEIRGPNGSLVIALAWTENPKRTKDSLAPILRKNNAVFANHSAKHNFEHKGIISAKPPSTINNPAEVIVDHAIECGAEEVVPCDIHVGVYKFVCELEQMHIVKSKLQTLNYEIQSAEFQFIPKLKVELTDEQLNMMSKLMDKLEEHPDIVKTYDNIL